MIDCLSGSIANDCCQLGAVSVYHKKCKIYLNLAYFRAE